MSIDIHNREHYKQPSKPINIRTMQNMANEYNYYYQWILLPIKISSNTFRVFLLMTISYFIKKAAPKTEGADDAGKGVTSDFRSLLLIQIWLR